MSEQVKNPGYGYEDDNVEQSGSLHFGGNFGCAYLKKFEWTDKGGKDGAEQEALDIIITINGIDKSYRQFPITKAFGPNNTEITDPNAKEFKDAVKDLNARLTHIVSCFRPKEQIQKALSDPKRPINSFKDFCMILKGGLTADFDKKALDVFLGYQWQISPNKNRTYLELPKKMRYGMWLAPAQFEDDGSPMKWEEQRIDNDDAPIALFYTNSKGEKHSFERSGWYMSTSFAKQQKYDTVVENESSEAKPVGDPLSAETTTAGTPGTADNWD